MITCPVCEHQQADAAECELCGRAPAPAGGSDAAAPAVVPMEGLETTAQPAVALAGAAAPLPEFEPTDQGRVGQVPVTLMPELELPPAAALDAPPEPVADLEPTAAAPPEPRTELPLFPVCRYCRTEAGPGEKLCGRCGMRLGLPETPAPAGASTGPRLCSCGTPISRAICPVCGARNLTG